MTAPMTVISNGKIVTSDGVVEGDLVLSGGTIECIETRANNFRGSPEIIDAAGGFVVPGLVDLHVHGAGGANLWDETSGSVDNVCRSLAGFGTTCCLATGLITAEKESDELDEVVDAVGSGRAGAQIVGIHLEGPFINPEKRGMIPPEYVQECSPARWREVWDDCRSKLRMMTIAPEVSGATDVIREMVDEGVIPALGHTNATLEEVRTGMEAGLSHVTHLANAMRGLHHREPGALGAALMEDDLSVQIIADGHHLHPEFVRWVVEMKGAERCCLVTDGIGPMGISAGHCDYQDYQCTIQDGAVYGPNGDLVGTTLTLLQIVQRAKKFTGLPLYEAVNMASLYPARVLDIADSKGSIAPGKDADVIVCDENFNVDAVLIGGRKSPTGAKY